MGGVRALELLAFGAPFALAACSLLTDFSGLSGGPASSDAAADAPLADARPDSDSSSDSDSGADSAADSDSDSAPDSAPLPFCASHPGHAECLDFDDGALPQGWILDVTQGSVVVATDRALSPPDSLTSTLPRRAAEKTAAQLRKKVASTFRHTVVELDFYVEPADWQSGDINAGVLEISFFTSMVNAGVAVSIGQSYVTVGAPGGAIPGNTPIPFGQWVHAKFDLDPAGTFTGTIGALPPFTQQFAPISGGMSAETQVRLGVDGYNAPAPQFVVHYDDVTLDYP